MSAFIWIASAAMAQPHPLDAASCTHCHTDPHPVGEQPCVACHTLSGWTPSTFTLEDHAETPFALTGRHADAPCRSCHIDVKLKGLPTECAGCHVDRHRGKLGDDCTECHNVTGFTPVANFAHTKRTGFALTGQHDDLACDRCHEGSNGTAMRMTANATCETCHADGHGTIGTCRDCHAEDHKAFADARKGYDHRVTSFPLERRHRTLPCRSCHPVGLTESPDPSCRSCHADVHAGQLGTVCADCHRPDRWSVARFDHDQTSFALRGRHFVAPCASCHTTNVWIGLSDQCFTCHQRTLRRAPANIPAHLTPFSNCGDCHNQWTFEL
ncbi:MAG: cytochrome c3 family protein [Myxococcota bacterium]